MAIPPTSPPLTFQIENKGKLHHEQVVQPPSLEVFKTQLNKALHNLVLPQKLPLPQAGR